jgi:hypothetical protein
MSSEFSNLCPACGYEINFEPWEQEFPSDGICPCCGIHFGYDDFAGEEKSKRQEKYLQWRANWINKGMKWFSRHTLPPKDWNPDQQLLKLKS